MAFEDMKQCKDGSYQIDCTDFGGDITIDMMIRGSGEPEPLEMNKTSEIKEIQAKSTLTQLGFVIGGIFLIVYVMYSSKK